MKFVNNFLNSTIRTLTTFHEVVSNPTSEVECFGTVIANSLRYIPVLVKLIYVRFHFISLIKRKSERLLAPQEGANPFSEKLEGDNQRRNFWVIVNEVVSVVCYVRPLIPPKNFGRRSKKVFWHGQRSRANSAFLFALSDAVVKSLF